MYTLLLCTTVAPPVPRSLNFKFQFPVSNPQVPIPKALAANTPRQNECPATEAARVLLKTTIAGNTGLRERKNYTNKQRSVAAAFSARREREPRSRCAALKRLMTRSLINTNEPAKELPGLSLGVESDGRSSRGDRGIFPTPRLASPRRYFFAA